MGWMGTDKLVCCFKATLIRVTGETAFLYKLCWSWTLQGNPLHRSFVLRGLVGVMSLLSRKVVRGKRKCIAFQFCHGQKLKQYCLLYIYLLEEVSQKMGTIAYSSMKGTCRFRLESN